MISMASTAAAAGVVVGAPGDPGTGNCYPFGCGYTPSEYQQVYVAGDFSGPITISEISFYNHNYLGGDVNSGAYNIYRPPRRRVCLLYHPTPLPI